MISDVSFALEPGQILAFLGHNGAGKTTTLRTRDGAAAAARRDGNVRRRSAIDRLDVAERVALGLRLLPEGRGIFPDLSGGGEHRRGGGAQLSARARCSASTDVYRLFPVLGERRTTRAGSLSGGQQQMLALSLAILGTPRCLLLDEPSIGLAPNLVERMFRAGAGGVQIARDDGGFGGTERRRGDADRRPRGDHEQRADRVRRTAGRGASVEFLALFLGHPRVTSPALRGRGRGAERRG